MEMSFNVKSRWRLDGILMMIPYTYNDDIYICHIKLRWRFKSYNEDFSESHQDRVLEEKTSKIKIQTNLKYQRCTPKRASAFGEEFYSFVSLDCIELELSR